jgi:hypothetical protein
MVRILLPPAASLRRTDGLLVIDDDERGGHLHLEFAFLDFAVVPAEWVKRVMTAVVAIDRGRSYGYPMQRRGLGSSCQDGQQAWRQPALEEAMPQSVHPLIEARRDQMFPVLEPETSSGCRGSASADPMRPANAWLRPARLRQALS